MRNTRVVIKAWQSMISAEDAPAIHPMFIREIVKIQRGACGLIDCTEPLVYDAKQLLSKKAGTSRSTAVSIQQLGIRGTLENVDTCPKFTSFPCL